MFWKGQREGMWAGCTRDIHLRTEGTFIFNLDLKRKKEVIKYLLLLLGLCRWCCVLPNRERGWHCVLAAPPATVGTWKAVPVPLASASDGSLASPLASVAWCFAAYSPLPPRTPVCRLPEPPPVKLISQPFLLPGAHTCTPQLQPTTSFGR